MRDYVCLDPEFQILVLDSEADLRSELDEGKIVKVLGLVCSDHCSTDCPVFVSGTCPAVYMRTREGELIRVLDVQ